MTERSRLSLDRSATALSIENSALSWNGGTMMVEIDEICAPLPLPLRGRVRIECRSTFNRHISLDGHGNHRWWPISPFCRVEVEFTHPSLRWRGEGYLDSNTGDMPLENSLRSWNWSRAASSDEATILYDVVGLSGVERSVALRFDREGTVEDFSPPHPMLDLPRSRWGVIRRTRSEAPSPAVRRTFVDAPFYSRSLIESQLLGRSVTSIHESVDLRRFVSMPVQLMLPFRAPRAPEWM